MPSSVLRDSDMRAVTLVRAVNFGKKWSLPCEVELELGVDLVCTRAKPGKKVLKTSSRKGESKLSFKLAREDSFVCELIGRQKAQLQVTNTKDKSENKNVKKEIVLQFKSQDIAQDWWRQVTLRIRPWSTLILNEESTVLSAAFTIPSSPEGPSKTPIKVLESGKLEWMMKSSGFASTTVKLVGDLKAPLDLLTKSDGFKHLGESVKGLSFLPFVGSVLGLVGLGLGVMIAYAKNREDWEGCLDAMKRLRDRIFGAVQRVVDGATCSGWSRTWEDDGTRCNGVRKSS